MDWDDDVPEDLSIRWRKWRESLFDLKNFNVPRCVKPNSFGNVVSYKLQHFSDAKHL